MDINTIMALLMVPSGIYLCYFMYQTRAMVSIDSLVTFHKVLYGISAAIFIFCGCWVASL